MDFLRVSVVDSLSLPVSGKGPPAIDLVLESSPDTASVSQHTRFQTEVLGTLMEHLLAADVLIGEQAALPVVPGGSLQYIAPNVCYLAARIVDKLWQGEHHVIYVQQVEHTSYCIYQYVYNIFLFFLNFWMVSLQSVDLLMVRFLSRQFILQFVSIWQHIKGNEKV
jgi:hypothetical protein